MILGAFANAMQAMQAMDVAMGTISQNVANVNTTGYKKADTQFQTLLSETINSAGVTQNSATNGQASSGTNIFGVMAANRNLISKQGTITGTSNWTDLAINGRGFFMVTPPNSTTGAPQSTASTSSTLFTRAGAFQQKAVGTNSYFTDANGNYLMGWMADAQGNIPGVATSAHSSVGTTTATTGGGGGSLVPIYTQPGQVISGIATTTIQAGMNLPADATATASPQSFVNTSVITDGTGVKQDLTMTWTRVDGDNWTVDFSLPASPASGSVGTITGSPINVTMDANGTITSPKTSASGSGFADLIIDWSSGPTVTTTPSVDLNSQKPTLQEVPVSLTVYDNAYNAETLPVTFERAGNDQWYMRINVPSTGGTVSNLTASGATAGSSSIPVTFDGSGNIQTPTSLSFSVAWTPSVTPTAPATVPIPSVLTPYSSSITSAVGTVTAPGLPATAAQLTAYGTALDTALSGIAVAAPATAADLTAYSASLVSALSTASDATQTAMTTAAAKAGTNTVTFDPSKLTQYVGTSPTKVDIKDVTQDGYASGVMDSASFTSTGELIAHFNNGQTRTLAMVPVASFVSPDALDPVSGTLFRLTQGAGAETIGTIASQGSGAAMVASSVETSNVDLADEFTRMIITQKAYSMNSKVLTTADEMLQTSRDLIK